MAGRIRTMVFKISTAEKISKFDSVKVDVD